MSDTNCPFCGCEIAPFREKGDVIRYSCRNPLVPNSAPRGPLCRELEAHNHTKRERDEAREELHKASVEANALATSIQKAEYSDAKEFELLGSVAGVISQIDNMYAGVRQQRDKAREQLRIAVGLLSTQPQFAIKHPEEVLAFIMEGTK